MRHRLGVSRNVARETRDRVGIRTHPRREKAHDIGIIRNIATETNVVTRITLRPGGNANGRIGICRTVSGFPANGGAIPRDGN